MIKRKSTLELVIGGAMPFVAIILLALTSFVTLGFKMPDSSFWLNTIVNTVALLCFFIPFKAIFIEKYLSSERIIGKQNAYIELVERIYNDKYLQFQDWTVEELEIRKQRVIKVNLQALRLKNAEEKFNSYGLDTKKIKRDESLSNTQKKIMINLIKRIGKMKKINPEECLPGIEYNTQNSRIVSNMKKYEKKATVFKVLRSLIICAGFAILALSTDFSNIGERYMAILVELAMKILIGLWHIYGASRLANNLVNNVYFNELSEKSLVITEFFEYEKKLKNT